MFYVTGTSGTTQLVKIAALVFNIVNALIISNPVLQTLGMIRGRVSRYDQQTNGYLRDIISAEILVWRNRLSYPKPRAWRGSAVRVAAGRWRPM